MDDTFQRRLQLFFVFVIHGDANGKRWVFLPLNAPTSDIGELAAIFHLARFIIGTEATPSHLRVHLGLRESQALVGGLGARFPRVVGIGHGLGRVGGILVIRALGHFVVLVGGSKHVTVPAILRILVFDVDVTFQEGIGVEIRDDVVGTTFLVATVTTSIINISEPCVTGITTSSQNLDFFCFIATILRHS